MIIRMCGSQMAWTEKKDSRGSKRERKLDATANSAEDGTTFTLSWMQLTASHHPAYGET